MKSMTRITLAAFAIAMITVSAPAASTMNIEDITGTAVRGSCEPTLLIVTPRNVTPSPLPMKPRVGGNPGSNGTLN